MMERAHDPDLKLAERYFLGELTNDEAEEFEAHYFDCARCAEYVVEELALMRSGEQFARAARELPANVVPLAPRRRREWWAAAAAAVLVLGLTTPLLLRNDRVEPTVEMTIPPTPIELALDRAAAPPPPVFREGSPIPFDVVITTEEGFARFVVAVRDGANKVVDREHELTAEAANETVHLVLRKLPAGTYNLVVEGVREDGNRSPIINQPFEVRGQEEKP
ncbi:MAG TPA: zf-HC2 domain-containing protein [Thermoanaerobaculia bacterium]|jgi:hypothetical protein